MMMTFFIAVGSFPLIFLAHLLYEQTWAKKNPPPSRQKMVAQICLWVSFFCALGTVAFEGWLDGLYVLAVSLGFGHVYFHIFNMSESARRIRILTSAYAAQKEGAVWEHPRGYTPERMVEERIERLKAMGALQIRGGKLMNRFHPLCIASVVLEKYQRLFI